MQEGGQHVYLTEEAVGELRARFPHLQIRAAGCAPAAAASAGGAPRPLLYVFPPCGTPEPPGDLEFCLRCMLNWKALSVPVEDAAIEGGRLYVKSALPFQSLRAHLACLERLHETTKLAEDLWRSVKALAEAGLYHGGVDCQNTLVVYDSTVKANRIAFAGFRAAQCLVLEEETGEKPPKFLEPLTRYFSLIMTGLLAQSLPSARPELARLLKSLAAREVAPTEADYQHALEHLRRKRKNAVDWSLWSSFLSEGARRPFQVRWMPLPALAVLVAEQVRRAPRTGRSIAPPPRGRGPKAFGLVNRASHCWANSALQMLYRDDCVRAALLSSSSDLRDEVLELLEGIFVAFDAAARSPLDVDAKVRKIQGDFQRLDPSENPNRDAVEFFLFVLGRLTGAGVSLNSRFCEYETLFHEVVNPGGRNVITNKVFFQQVFMLSPSGVEGVAEALEEHLSPLVVDLKRSGVASSNLFATCIWGDGVYVQIKEVQGSKRSSKFRIPKEMTLAGKKFGFQSAIVNLPNHYFFFDFRSRTVYDDAKVVQAVEVSDADGALNFTHRGATLAQNSSLLCYRRMD